MRMGERRGDEAGIGWGELGKGETSKIDGSRLKEGGDEDGGKGVMRMGERG